MIVSVTPSRHEFLLAPWNFLCLCCWRLITVVLRTFFFEFFFFFFFDRTLSANACPYQCTGALSPLKPELKKTHVPWWLMCRANWQSQRVRYFLRPTKLRWSRKENLREGTKTPGVVLLANTINAVRTANSLASWTNKDRHSPCAITFSPLRRCPPWKKVWWPTCPLNGSFQSPNCPLKGMFHSPNGIF